MTGADGLVLTDEYQTLTLRAGVAMIRNRLSSAGSALVQVEGLQFGDESFPIPPGEKEPVSSMGTPRVTVIKVKRADDALAATVDVWVARNTIGR